MPFLGFWIFIRPRVGLLWTGDQLVAKTSTDTEQHNTQTKTNIHAPGGIWTRYPSNQAVKTYALDRAATRTGRFIYLRNERSSTIPLRLDGLQTIMADGGGGPSGNPTIPVFVSRRWSWAGCLGRGAIALIDIG
jgi:hypothetical protein